jgi:hypothetical protein
MPSFQITVKSSKRAAGRFVYSVRRALQKAYAEEQAKSGLTQTAMAQAIGVHRSVISRELRGKKDITMGRVGELAWAMGRKPYFALPVATVFSGYGFITNYSLAQAVPFQGTSLMTAGTLLSPDPSLQFRVSNIPLAQLAHQNVKAA